MEQVRAYLLLFHFPISLHKKQLRLHRHKTPSPKTTPLTSHLGAVVHPHGVHGHGVQLSHLHAIYHREVRAYIASIF